MKLPTIQNSDGKYCLLAFDDSWRLASKLGFDLHQPEHVNHYSQVMTKLVETLSPHATGVSLDSEFVFNASSKKSEESGPIFSLDKKQVDIQPQRFPVLLENWGVEQTRNNYSLAKLTLFYSPHEPDILQKQRLVTELYDYCKYENIDFLLELLVGYQENTSVSVAQLIEDQLKAIHDLRRVCDLMALEFLGDSLAAATITAELDIPWIVTSRNQSYEQCKDELRACLDSGAQGFIYGDLFIPELNYLQLLETEEKIDQSSDQNEFDRAIQTKVRDSVLELRRIVDEV